MSYICELATCIARNCLSVSNNVLSIYLCREHLNDLDLVRHKYEVILKCDRYIYQVTASYSTPPSVSVCIENIYNTITPLFVKNGVHFWCVSSVE